MKHIITILALVLLTGCAAVRQSELVKWSDATKAMAQSGQIKWSDYYTQLFDKIEEADLGIHKGYSLQAANGLIDAAKQYENGQISKEQFEAAQRSAKAYVAQARSAIIANSDDGVSSGMNSMSNAFKQNAEYFQSQQRSSRTIQSNQTTCRRLGAYTTCQ